MSSKTDLELKQLAADIYENKVFTDRHVHKEHSHILSMVFIPLILKTYEVEVEQGKEISLIYEYMDKAGPRAINGYPIFLSVNFLTREEHERMNTFYESYKTIKETFLK